MGRSDGVPSRDPNATLAKWGQCIGGAADLQPVPPPCQETLAVLHCGLAYPGSVCCPFHGSCTGTEPLLEFNTGADDPELLLPVEDPNTPVGGIQARFLIPNPSTPAPTLHWVSAGAVRDLDVLEGNIDNVDMVLQTDVTYCPIVADQPVCVGPPMP